MTTKKKGEEEKKSCFLSDEEEESQGKIRVLPTVRTVFSPPARLTGRHGPGPGKGERKKKKRERRRRSAGPTPHRSPSYGQFCEKGKGN